MIGFLIDFVIFFYVIFPLSVLVLGMIFDLFRKQEKYVAPEKPYTIEDWLCSKH